MTAYYLAVDIGASSGRHLLGHLENGHMVTEEIYRFENGMLRRGDCLCWDMPRLFSEVKEGMKRCRLAGKCPVSMGIDTWAVDFVLLDEDDNMLGPAVGYRDRRTEGMDRRIGERISERKLYERTGIQKQPFNTIYQLEAVRRRQPQLLKKARSMLLVPDFLHFLLTGKKATEYTNATTTQLVSPITKDWDRELIGMLDFPQRLFGQVVTPGCSPGTLSDRVISEVGFDCRVVLPATHDTASAVMAVPAPGENTLYLSSGTWSLMGVERMQADCTEESRLQNFTNEGGYDYRFRYLKNIMGLWMIQSLRRECSESYTFAQLCEMASEEAISSLTDCNDSRFLSPESMTGAVREYCRESGQPVPESTGQLARVIYRSLADCYGKTVRKLKERTGMHYESLYIVGGGANAGYLNRLTAVSAGLDVYAGPAEASGIGNLMAQMIHAGELADLSAARRCIYESFPVKQYRPHKDAEE